MSAIEIESHLKLLVLVRHRPGVPALIDRLTAQLMAQRGDAR